jgi:hypothetical protein
MVFSLPNVAAHFKPMQKRPSFTKLLSYGKEMTALPSRLKQIFALPTHAVAGTHKEQVRKSKISRFKTSRFVSQ